MAAGDGGVFISYRRDDTAWPAARLYDLLAARLGAEHLFKDVDNIEPGQDFVARLNSAVADCDVVLVLIGREWLSVTDDAGRRRLDDPRDFVRLEVGSALAGGKLVVPILVDGAEMPPAESLPPDLAPLTRRQAVEISPVNFDIDRLMRVVGPALGVAPATGRRRGRFPSARRTTAAVVVVVGVAVLVAIPVAGMLLNRASPSLVGNTPEPTPPAATPGATLTGLAPPGTPPNLVGVGDAPMDVVVDWVWNKAYVANSGDGTVSVIDTATNQVGATVAVGGRPMAVVVDSPARRAYVADADGGAVTVLDIGSDTVAGSIPVGLEPMALVVDEKAHRLYVANAGEDTVSVVDTVTATVTNTVGVGRRPVGLALDVVEGIVLVATVEDDHGTQLDIESLAVSPVPTGDATSDVRIEQVSHRSVWAFPRTNEVSLVGEQVVSLPVGKAPAALALDESGKRLYVVNTLDNTMTVIATDTGTVAGTVATGGGPTGLDVDGDSRRVWVVNSNDDTVSILAP
ncbi:MAG: TIR domain-containing protein [Propionicimonas sp.]